MGRGGARQNAGRKAGKVGEAKKALIEQAKEQGKAALETLTEIHKDKSAPHSARVAAANAILDRGFGRPRQSIDHSSEDGSMAPPPNEIRLVAVTPDE